MIPSSFPLLEACPVTVDRAVREDIPTLLCLLRQILKVHHEGRPDLFRPRGEKYNEEDLNLLLEDPRRPVYVAREGERVLGYAFCILKETKGNPVFEDRKTLYLDDLCVEEHCRGCHVGSLLYEHVCREARRLCCHNVELNVWAFNEGALAFYEKMGLRPQKIGMEVLL